MTYINAGKSKPKQNWRTPKSIFTALDAEFGFCCDLFADPQNALCDTYFTEARSAFDSDWKFKYPVFGNPPYARGFIDLAIDYAYEQVRVKKNLPCVVLLLPLTTPKWFGRAMRDFEVHQYEGRINFVAPEGLKSAGSNFSNMLVIVRPEEDDLRGVTALRCSKTGVVTHDFAG